MPELDYVIILTLKIKIIKNCLLYIEGKQSLKTDILKDLKTYAGYFHVKPKKVARINLKQALMEFIECNQGTNNINKLNSSL